MTSKLFYLDYPNIRKKSEPLQRIAAGQHANLLQLESIALIPKINLHNYMARLTAFICLQSSVDCLFD